MRRIMLIITLIIGVASAYADEKVYRVGNTYMYNGQSMNKYEYRNFLSSNYTPAYEQFRNGFITSNVGWGLLAGGLAMDIAGTGFLLVGIEQRENNNSADASEKLGKGISSVMLILFSHAFFIAGGALEIASIPTLSVGYARMHKSVDVYNVRRAQPTNVSLGVSTSGNGVGLALSF